jgi:hypothetical protein
MSQRIYVSRFPCAHAGCNEYAHYEDHTRAEQAKTYKTYGGGKWRCVRHSNPDSVLSPTNTVRITELKSEQKFYDGKPLGIYWGHSGFVSGPGFRAFAADFPEGTVLRITAEIVLP